MSIVDAHTPLPCGIMNSPIAKWQHLPLTGFFFPDEATSTLCFTGVIEKRAAAQSRWRLLPAGNGVRLVIFSTTTIKRDLLPRPRGAGFLHFRNFPSNRWLCKINCLIPVRRRMWPPAFRRLALKEI